MDNKREVTTTLQTSVQNYSQKINNEAERDAQRGSAMLHTFGEETFCSAVAIRMAD